MFSVFQKMSPFIPNRRSISNSLARQGINYTKLTKRIDEECLTVDKRFHVPK